MAVKVSKTGRTYGVYAKQKSGRRILIKKFKSKSDADKYAKHTRSSAKKAKKLWKELGF